MPSAWAAPVFDVGGGQTVKTVNRVDITQTVGMHDVAVVTLRGEDMSAPDLRPGTTVQIQYGWNPIQLEMFYGYIDHIESSYEKGTPSDMHFDAVVCLGASYVMKDPFVGAWSTVKASTLVQSVAAQYQFASLVQNDDFTWPQLSAPGCSAWQFLINMAQKLGYVLTANKTLLRFVSVDQSLAQNTLTMPTFYTRRSAPNVMFQSISNFHSIEGETFRMPGRSKANRIAGGIDQRSGQVIVMGDTGTIDAPYRLGVRSPDPFFSQFQTDLVVTDQAQGNASLNGLAQRNRFIYYAEASLSGDASVVGGVPILLTGLNDKDDGAWWVEEVTHKIDYTHYTMDVRLGRDSSKDSGVRPTGTPYTRRNFAIAPPTILVQNRWRAAYQANLVVSTPP